MLEFKRFLLESASGHGKLKDGVETVSYTHLDVYKRQAAGSSPGRKRRIVSYISYGSPSFSKTGVAAAAAARKGVKAKAGLKSEKPEGT